MCFSLDDGPYGKTKDISGPEHTMTLRRHSIPGMVPPLNVYTITDDFENVCFIHKRVERKNFIYHLGCSVWRKIKSEEKEQKC